MANYITAVIAAVVALCALYACPTDGAPSSDANRLSLEKEQMIFIAKLLGPIRDIAREAALLESVVEAVLGNEKDFSAVMKRQGAYDMDYGWGGGRFGKRGPLDVTDKRYDSFGIGGRFGRSSDRAEKAKTKH